MNTAFLQTTTPSNGLNTVLGNIPPSSAPAKGALAMMTPSVHNRVKEPMINPVASYPIMVRPWKNNWQHMLHAGDLIFVNRADALNKRLHKINRLQQRFPELVVANLPLLNYLLRQQSSNPTNAEQALADITQWSFLGVMRNDMQITGTSDYRTNASASTKEQAMRLINVDVRGTTRAFNYWQNANVGCNVYLQVAKMDMHAIPNAGNAIDSIVSARDAMQKYQSHVNNLTKQINHADFNSPEQRKLKEELKDYQKTRVVTQVLPVTGNMGTGDTITKDLPRQNETFVSGSGFMEGNMIHIAWLFQHLGPAERSSSSANIYNATQFFDDRFRLPVIPMMMRT
tara:strand:+ start:47031 stop:48056 length:1026 start_codon:yes stop_codon:yes gene_type:complete